ncbi:MULTISPECIES: hypothetical protein [Nostocales]|uniref:Uncharacterized protein n=3 Tax=Nostocales TaxID=1161 RepID=A0A0C1NKC4_9CYAN|nr:hypothetical protein [Tolypothrix bouteillei]KAF3887729.1 hypothetical protein DA73_0400021195 [Tolypothrix bouteillei VB521301]
MPLENEKIHQKIPASTSLAQQSLQESFQDNQPTDVSTTQVENAYVERVIAEAVQQEQEIDNPTQFTVNLGESQEKIAKEIRQALGLSFEVTLNSAIKYALFYANSLGVSISNLEEYPRNLAAQSIKMKVTPDTWYKLKAFNATDQISECIVIGLQLLYKQLINIKINNEHS